MKIRNSKNHNIQPHFKGIYEFVTEPKLVKALQKSVDTDRLLRNELSFLMYEKDMAKGELKVGDTLISIIFNYLGKTFGITGGEALTMQKKIFSKSGNPPVGDKIMGNSIKGKHFKHSVFDIKRALGESFKELLSEKKLDMEDIEKIEPIIN